MSSRSGDSTLRLLFILLVLVAIGAFVGPKLLKSKELKEESTAIETLRSIYAAQKDIYGASRMYGSMQRLSNSKLIQRSQDSFKELGYEFYHSTDGRGSTWCATATPEAGKSGRSFGIDESGSVYSTQLRCSNGQLTMENGQFPIDEKFRLGK